MNADPIKALLRRFRGDFPFYAKHCLKIQDKRGKTEPFLLNKAQLYLHERLEDQKRRTGKVRALVLKGRQQGISTYTEARFFWRTTLWSGLRAMIMTHLQDSTDNLFLMVERYLSNAPHEVRPAVGHDSAKELSFPKLDGGYRVTTAGSGGTGRGRTIQLFHGSEAAFWKNTEEHFSGLGQAVADMPGTEIILESTANGVGDAFHRMWQDAERGVGDYEAVFIPWYWQDEYRRPVPADFVLSSSEENNEVEYVELYGCDMEQMAWRRAKIETDFRGDVLRFQREYPATSHEAFVAADTSSLIKSKHVYKARKKQGLEAYGPLVVGVDPARYGNDRTGIVLRRGRVVQEIIALDGKNTMETAGIVARLIEEQGPDAVFIDEIGIGAGVVDRLNELGYDDVVIPVNAGAKATDDEHYVNKRAEMWANMRDWFETEGVSVPDDDALQADLCAPQFSYDSTGIRLKLESKDAMRKRGVRSPDIGDGLALTFSYPVSERAKRQRAADSIKSARRNRTWRTA